MADRYITKDNKTIFYDGAAITASFEAEGPYKVIGDA